MLTQVSSAKTEKFVARGLLSQYLCYTVMFCLEVTRKFISIKMFIFITFRNSNCGTYRMYMMTPRDQMSQDLSYFLEVSNTSGAT